MSISAEEQSPLRLLALSVLLSLIDGELTGAEIARQSGLSLSKVNSIIEELRLRRLVVEAAPRTRDQFIEPQFRIADGEAAMETLNAEFSENSALYILQILDAVRHELPKAMQRPGTKAQAWYSRLLLMPEQARNLMERLVRLLAEFEELQKVGLATTNEGPSGRPARRNQYRISITFFSIGPEEE